MFWQVYPIDIYAFGLVAWTGNDVLNTRYTCFSMHWTLSIQCKLIWINHQKSVAIHKLVLVYIAFHHDTIPIHLSYPLLVFYLPSVEKDLAPLHAPKQEEASSM